MKRVLCKKIASKVVIASLLYVGSSFINTAYSMSCNAAAKTQAIQEIEYLKRRYAKATDRIGIGTPEFIAEGRAIYQKVFTTDARMDAGPGREPQVGPDDWADLVLGALGGLGPTQHLIGTQLVEINSLKLDDECNVLGGSASMESYVQAWHEQKDEKVWLFLGTYFEDVVFIPGTGWRIEKMILRQVAGETRYMDAAVGRALE